MELTYEEKGFYIFIYFFLHKSSRVQHTSGKVLRAAIETKGELS